MASLTQSQGVAPHLLSPVGNQVAVAEPVPQALESKPRDVTTTFHYYKDPEDGGPPPPTYVANPATFERPALAKQAVVHDIRGSLDQYTLDTTGFQIYKHKSAETDFLDDDQIKTLYYPETEELLKQA